MTRVKMFENKTLERLEEEVNLYINNIELSAGKVLNVNVNPSGTYLYFAVVHYTFEDCN
jgi:hypothetical protein